MNRTTCQLIVLMTMLIALGCSKSPAPPSAPATDTSQPEESSAPTTSPENARVELSEAKVTRGTGGKKTFSVNYRFVEGEPSSVMQYRLVITPEDGSARAVEVLSGMAASGTLQDEQLDPKDLLNNKPISPTKAHMEIDFGGTPKVISNEITFGE